MILPNCESINKLTIINSSFDIGSSINRSAIKFPFRTVFRAFFKISQHRDFGRNSRLLVFCLTLANDRQVGLLAMREVLVGLRAKLVPWGPGPGNTDFHFTLLLRSVREFDRE